MNIMERKITKLYSSELECPEDFYDSARHYIGHNCQGRGAVLLITTNEDLCPDGLVELDGLSASEVESVLTDLQPTGFGIIHKVLGDLHPYNPKVYYEMENISRFAKATAFHFCDYLQVNETEGFSYFAEGKFELD